MTNSPPDFSIITPSYNMLNYLWQCCNSVADQAGASFEHIVVDGASSDGTAQWLASNPSLISISEKDEGMYDAINKGLNLARGDVFAYLNCDEQYLPGTLQAVKRHFVEHPNTDVIFSDTLYVRPDGSLTHFRKAYQPRWSYILAAHLYIMTCSTFFRRKVLEDGYLFNDRYRVVSDSDFIVRLLRGNYRFSHLRRYTATFTLTGTNAMLSPSGRQELLALRKTAPQWVRGLRFPLNLARLIEKALSGAYSENMPIRYEIYTPSCQQRRQAFEVTRTSAIVHS